jgi:hypothetical protein
MYGNWLRMGLTSRTLLDSAAKETEKLKNEVREQRCRIQREQRKKEDEAWEKAHGVSMPSSSMTEYRNPYPNVPLDPDNMA